MLPLAPKFLQIRIQQRSSSIPLENWLISVTGLAAAYVAYYLLAAWQWQPAVIRASHCCQPASQQIAAKTWSLQVLGCIQIAFDVFHRCAKQRAKLWRNPTSSTTKFSQSSAKLAKFLLHGALDGSKACVICRSHCWSLRARVPGSPGSSFGNSGTRVCNVFKTIFSSAVLGAATDANGIAVPV